MGNFVTQEMIAQLTGHSCMYIYTRFSA